MSYSASTNFDKEALVALGMPVDAIGVKHPLQGLVVDEFGSSADSIVELRKGISEQLEEALVNELYQIKVLTAAQRIRHAETAKHERPLGEPELLIECSMRQQLQRKKEAISKKKESQALEIAESEKKAAHVAGALKTEKDQIKAVAQSIEEVEISIRQLIATRKRQLDDFYAAYAILLSRRQLEKEGKLSKKDAKAAQKVVYRWLPIAQALLNSNYSSSFKFMLLSRIVSTDTVLGVPYWDIFKKYWVECNWARLLLLRIKRVIIAFLEVLDASSEFFGQVYSGFAQAYQVLGHLGYAVYLLRLACHSIPKLVSAFLEEGFSGFKRVWREESLSICNDLVWASVGVAGFCIASTFGCMMMVVALYLFDVLNILIHELLKKSRIKAEIKKENEELKELSKFIGDSRYDRFKKLEDLIKQDKYKEKIAAAPKETREAVRLLVAKELVRENKLFDYAGRVSAALARSSKLASDRAACNSRLRAGMIESVGLFIGMALAGAGVGIVASATTLGVTGSVTVAAFAMTAATLSAAATTGLALIAIGAAFVIFVCAYRLIKKIVDTHKSKALKKRVKEREKKAGLELTTLKIGVSRLRSSSDSLWARFEEDESGVLADDCYDELSFA